MLYSFKSNRLIIGIFSIFAKHMQLENPLENKSTVKTVIFMRHGEAESSSVDFIRNLTQAGRLQARSTARDLYENGIIPQLILSSTANRAIQTAKILANEINYSIDHIVEMHEIYEASTRTILEIINAVEDWVNILLLVGHNPTFSTMVSYISQSNVYLGTASAAVIHLHAERWAYVSMGTGDLEILIES